MQKISLRTVTWCKKAFRSLISYSHCKEWLSRRIFAGQSGTLTATPCNDTTKSKSGIALINTIKYQNISEPFFKNIGMRFKGASTLNDSPPQYISPVQ